MQCLATASGRKLSSLMQDKNSSDIQQQVFTFFLIEDIKGLEQLMFGTFYYPHPGLLFILKCPMGNRRTDSESNHSSSRIFWLLNNYVSLFRKTSWLQTAKNPTSIQVNNLAPATGFSSKGSLPSLAFMTANLICTLPESERHIASNCLSTMSLKKDTGSFHTSQKET